MTTMRVACAKHWRDRAEEARMHAEDMHDQEARRMMLEIAESYERLALRAEERERLQRT